MAELRDMRGDSFFASTGIITLRYSWADISTRPCQVAREIGLVLRQRGWTGALRACQAPARPDFLDHGH